MNPPWLVDKTANFTQCADREKISSFVLNQIDSWAKTVTLTPTKNFRCCFVSPKRIFQIWNAKIADPDYRKGKRSGFRLVCFFLTQKGMVFLDMIERRNELGGKNEHPKDQQRYTKYINDLKNELISVYENNN